MTANGKCSSSPMPSSSDERTYLLSRLLRGQLGSEWAMSDPLPAGARFVLLDRALMPVAKSIDLVGRSFDYRVGPADVDVGDPRMTSLSATVTPTALLPWSPAHLRGERTDEGVRISLDPPHAHERRRLGSAGSAAQRGGRSVPGGNPRRRRCRAHHRNELRPKRSTRPPTSSPISARRRLRSKSASRSSPPSSGRAGRE